MLELEIRDATIKDSRLILACINELAIYEKAESEVLATVEDIQSALFDSTSSATAIIFFADDDPIGFAVYFLN